MSRQVLVSSTMKSIAIFIVYFVKVESVPPEYCLHPLNTSDCHMKPTAVFSYYKSGSRCEIEYWRGCPTYNKFDNQYDCVDMCIYHYRVHYKAESVEVTAKSNITKLEEELKELSAEDLGQLNEVVEEVAQQVKKLHHVETGPPEPEPTGAPEVPEEAPEETPEETPEEETEAPEAATEVPATETEAPATETEAPAAETEAPAAETEASAAETEAPAVETTAPAAKTEPAAQEETDAPAETTTAKVQSDESGLPDEVELP